MNDLFWGKKLKNNWGWKNNQKKNDHFCSGKNSSMIVFVKNALKDIMEKKTIIFFGRQKLKKKMGFGHFGFAKKQFFCGSKI